MSNLKKKVVIATDTYELAKIVARMIQLVEGIDVLAQVYDGEAGLIVANSLSPDLLIVADTLPNLSGEEVAQSFKSANPSSKALVITRGDRAFKRLQEFSFIDRVSLAPMSVDEFCISIAALWREQSKEDLRLTLAELSKEISRSITAAGQKGFLGHLPDGSWSHDLTVADREVVIRVTRQDDLLKEHSWHEIMDHSIWIYHFVPEIARTISRFEISLPQDLQIAFTSSNGDTAWHATAPVSRLIEAVRNGEIDKGGRLMSILKVDLEE